MNDNSKSYHCTENGVYACYNDSKVNSFISYDKDPMLNTQLYGNSYKKVRAQNFEDNRYSFNQYKLYQRCLYGLKVISPAELKRMSLQEKMRIQFNHVKTQRLINLSKWQATSELANSFIINTFKKVKSNMLWFINATAEITMEDNQDINLGTLKQIGGKDELIKKLVELNILPANFYNLNRV